MKNDKTKIKCSDCINYKHMVNMILMGTEFKQCVECSNNNPVGIHYKERK